MIRTLMQKNLEPHSGLFLQFLAVLLLGAQILFLWMFFSAESIEQLAVNDQVSGSRGPDIGFVASRFAARWKHGMAGNSPLYMPGFFAVGILTWLWTLGRPVWRVIPEWFVITAIAASIAACLAPFGAVRAVHSFVVFSGFTYSGSVPGFTLAGTAVSLYTLFTWCTGIYCVQLAITRRSMMPMGFPIVLNFLLLRLRPWAINNYTTQWTADVMSGQPVAIFSLLAVPASAFLLIVYQLRREGPPPENPV